MELLIVFSNLLFLVAIQESSAFSTDIKGPPSAKQRDIKKIVKLGDDVRIQCPIYGNPPPIIEWKKGKEIIDYSWIRIRTKNKAMKIKKAQEDDTGVYICKGVNGFGNVEVLVNLIVINPANFPDLKEGELPDVSTPELTALTRDSKSYYVKKNGDSFRVVCEATGNPPPEIFWYKDGLPFDADGIRYKDSKSTIKLRNLMKVDSAVYTCLAKNLLGSIAKNFTLHVEVPSSEQPTVTGNGNMTVMGGETASLQCKVKSFNPPHIKWLKKQAPDAPKDDYTLNVGKDRYRVIHTGEDIPIGTDEYFNKLVIHNVKLQDEGLYICFVTNNVGSFNYKPSYLRVIPSNKDLDIYSSFPAVNGESTSILVLVISLGVIVIIILLSTIAFVAKKNFKARISSPENREVIQSLMAPTMSLQSTSSISTVSGNNDYEKPLPPPPPIWANNDSMNKSDLINREFSQSLHENSCTNLLSDNESSVSSSDQSGNMYEVPFCQKYGVQSCQEQLPAPILYTISRIPEANTTLTSKRSEDSDRGHFPFHQYPYYPYLNNDYVSY